MADWALARYGLPPMTCEFHSGIDGRARRVCSKKGWKTLTASASSKFAPPQRTPSGTDEVHGAVL